ncbi:hypothetical protein BLX88_23810, partial [Bacillus obstructivus]
DADLHLAVDVHDGEGVEQRADQDAADHDAEHAAADAAQADAADHDDQHDVEDHGPLRDRHLHAACRADPAQACNPGEHCNQHVLEHDQRPQRNAGQPRGFRIVALRIDEAADRGARQEQMHRNRTG